MDGNDGNGHARGKRTVLIVDDQRPARRLVRHAFGGRYRVLEAEDSDSTLAAMIRERVDLILLDLHLPPRLESPEEGLRTYVRIRERAPEVPVVIVTSDDNPGLREALLGRGARGYLNKPIDVDALSSLVRDVLGE